jgi:hypothetical protein
VHRLSGQHGPPGAPQATQTPPLQSTPAPVQVPVLLVVVPQHAKPKVPHLAQVPPLHLVSAAVQTPPAGVDPQQGWPGPPQLPHEPSLQMPLPNPTQGPPGDRQIPETQHAPPPQELPSQQGMPGLPQLAVAASGLGLVVMVPPLAPPVPVGPVEAAEPAPPPGGGPPSPVLGFLPPQPANRVVVATMRASRIAPREVGLCPTERFAGGSEPVCGF